MWNFAAVLGSINGYVNGIKVLMIGDIFRK